MYIPEDLQPYVQMYYDALHKQQQTDPFIVDKYQFQKENPVLKIWADQVIAPSLFQPKTGMYDCIESINQEPDDFLKLVKFTYVYRVWDQFGDANSDEVALDLVAQGYDIPKAARSIRQMLFDEINPDFMEQLKQLLTEEVGEEELNSLELVQNSPTMH